MPIKSVLAWPSTAFVACALLLIAGPLKAQSDVIRGKVTDPGGNALAGVRVSATSIPGGVTRSASTNNSGSFQIAFPGGEGDYLVGFAHVGYAFRQIEVKRVADEAVLIADARLAPIELDSIVVVAPSAERVNRSETTPDVGGTEQLVSPDVLPADLAGDFAALAASLPGVALVPGLDGEPDGFSVLGMDAEANSITLNGVPTSAGSLPRDAAVQSSLTTSPFDVSRGGFSGGNLDVRTRAGSNLKTRGFSFVSTTPQLQWTDAAGRALRNDYTNLSLGGLVSGPISLNKSFYNLSFQLGRNSRDNQSLLTTSPLGLQTAGVAPDSVLRLASILGDQSVPTGVGGLPTNRVNDNGSFYAGFEFSPPSSSSGQSFGISLDGNWARLDPILGAGSATLALASSSGDRINWGGGLQGRHSGYFGLILSETTVGLNLLKSRSDPYLELPGGRVRVSSTFDDGTGGVQSLTFGGNQGLLMSSTNSTMAFQNALSWFDNDNKHRIKLSSELQYRGTSSFTGSNLLGTYTFNSLADLEEGRAASFSRTLSSRDRSTGQLIAALSLGDSWRRSPDVQFQYGLRFDWSHFTTTPVFNPIVESTFGRRNDRVPDSYVLSPRLGFSWTLGEAQDVGAFLGAVQGPRALIRGGIGLFASNPGGQISQVLDNTGLPSGVQTLNCVGPAVPTPNWNAFAVEPGSIPDHCADGSSGTLFSTGAPNVTLFSEDFAPSRVVRANTSWAGSIFDARFALTVEGTYSRNMGQQRSIDLNLNPTPRFGLDDGRPVFVEPTSIVSSTGAIASRAARISSDFNRVLELRSDLRSRTVQLSMRLAPIPRTVQRFSWSGSYTYTNVREQVSGFSSTAGDPFEIAWAPSPQGAHQITYNLRYNLLNAIQINWNGSFSSGGSYTPMVGGDVNGDGYNNDRAFVYDPAGTSDAPVANGMRDLLATTSGAARDCLERQLGSIAERNSCKAPWSSAASLNLTLDRAKFHMPNRGAVSFSLSNPLGAADLIFNGSDNLKGWGQSAQPDGTLLYVRGFDSQTKRYSYEVNQRFGATRPRFTTLRSPVTLTASVKIDLGPTRERQTFSQRLDLGRSLPGARYTEALLRTTGTGLIINPMTTILRTQDTLRLTTKQADSIGSMNRRFIYQTDSIWIPVSRFMASLPVEYDENTVNERTLAARRAQVDLLLTIGPAILQLLTKEQLRMLPPSTLRYLDPRTLVLIRDGTPMYVNGGGAGALVGVPVEGAISISRGTP